MAAKANTSNDQIDLTTYDWVGKGIVNPDPTLQIKVPACGWCHPGSGPMEYMRDANGEATTTRYDEVDEASQAAYDGDFWTMVGDPDGDGTPNPGKSHWTESGVVEADCLLCHYQGYSFGKRNAQLTYRNYKWAATAGAQIGTISGKVYNFTNDAKGNYLTGEYVENPVVTVSYDTAALVEGKLDGSKLFRTPTQNQCKQCHTSADTKKRGRTMAVDTDVHLAAGLDCMDCHRNTMAGANAHDIGKGYARLGTVADQLDGTMPTCGECHDGRTIAAADGADHVAVDPAAAHDGALHGLDFHFEKISCETCHIPYKKYTAGELIDMSTGNQVWYLTSGDTIKWPGDFGGNAIEWKPISKFYDPDGAGPMGEKLYPFGAKSSTWFGRLLENGEIQPMLLKEVKAAWGAIGSPKIEVDYVKGGTVMKPSLSTTAQKVDMLLQLTKAGREEPVFVSGEVVYGLNETGDGLVAMHVEGEFDHNFSVNHDVRDSAEALGANGCTDCHSDGSALFETQQVTDVTGYLAESYKNKAEPYAAPAWEFQEYEWFQADALVRDADYFTDFANDHDLAHNPIISYADEGEAVCRDCHDPHGGIPDEPFPHQWFQAEYAEAGAGVCITCHTDSVHDFTQTVHYSSRSVVENENFFFPGGGKHGMLDRACALVGSNMLLNMLTTGYLDLNDVDSTTGNPAQQCGGCHTNYYLTLMEPMLAQQMGAEAAEQVMLSGVDCLVCHAEDYDMRLRKTLEVDPYGLNMGFGTVNGQAQRVAQDRSEAALESIGSPTDEMCLRCHEHGRTDYKRGELPEPDHDIHYELGVSADNPCTFCHEAKNHKFNRGAMVNGDIFAADYPVNSDDNDAACVNCHTDRPHTSTRLNSHVDALACETCHITYTAGAETTIWADGGFLALAKGTDNRPVKLYTKKEDDNNLTPEELWENYRQRPIYMPFSGLTSFLAQSIPVDNQNPLMSGGQVIEPKIFPFKTIINPLPFDGRFFGVGVETVDADGDGINDYSMFAAIRMFEQQYKMLGFMDADFDFGAFVVDGSTGMVATTWPMNDPDYPSYAAMAQMAAFPNMLFFDKYTFGHNWYQDLGDLADAGQIVTWDEQYRPLAVKDMRKAVEVGMGRLLDMMVQMGYQAPAGMTIDMLKGMYGKYDAVNNPYGLTDDQLVVMAAPPGSEMQMMLQQMKDAGMADISDTLIQNYPAWSNGVTLGGHGVRKSEALFCADCHSSEEDANVFDQKVEVPSYGQNGMPLMQWVFYDKSLIDLAEAGQVVEDVEQAGYTLTGQAFEMGVTFRTAGQEAAALGITYGVDGDYLAMLTPVTRLVSNWKVLGYTDARIAALTGRDGGGSIDSDEGSSSGEVGTNATGSSECFVQTLGGCGIGSVGGLGVWVAGLFAVLGALGVNRRR